MYGMMIGILIEKTANNTIEMNKVQNIPQGYKETVLGIIPQEWEIKRLKTIATPIKTFHTHEIIE